MQCQNPGCVNIGVHSCSLCGKLVCGMHVDEFFPGSRGLRCSSCGAEWRERKRISDKAEAERSEPGCNTALIGSGLFVVGVIFLVIAQFPHSPILAIIGVVIGGLGLLLGIIGIIMVLVADS